MKSPLAGCAVGTVIVVCLLAMAVPVNEMLGKGVLKMWISVNDRLPEVENGEFSRSVLVVDSGGQMAVAWRNAIDKDEEEWATDNGKCVCIDDVEYWCELPEPPNAKVSGDGTASAGLPGSAAGGNEERGGNE